MKHLCKEKTWSMTNCMCAWLPLASLLCRLPQLRILASTEVKEAMHTTACVCVRLCWTSWAACRASLTPVPPRAFANIREKMLAGNCCNLHVHPKSCNTNPPSTGVKTEKIDKGRIWGGVKGYLEGIFGNPSLTTIQGKTNKNQRKTKQKTEKKIRTASFSLFFLCFEPRSCCSWSSPSAWHHKHLRVQTNCRKPFLSTQPLLGFKPPVNKAPSQYTKKL